MGSGGQVSAVTRHVVFKCPTLFDDAHPEQVDDMEESIKRIENEKAVHGIMMKHRHPNIVYAILCIPEGFFMHRLEMTLETRLAKSPSSAISPTTQEQWILQLTSALAWLERLGLVHGDLRPANILLDVNGDIKVGDFDSTVKQGEPLMVGGAPFCKLDKNYESHLTGPLSEKNALGSCIYTIRFGHIPFHDMDGHAMTKKLILNQFPSTSADTLLGDVMQRCWDGFYDSISALEQDIVSQLKRHASVIQYLKNETQWEMNDPQPLMLLAV